MQSLNPCGYSLFAFVGSKNAGEEEEESISDLFNCNDQPLASPGSPKYKLTPLSQGGQEINLKSHQETWFFSCSPIAPNSIGIFWH